MNIKDFELFLQIHDHTTDVAFSIIKRTFREALVANKPDHAQALIDELINQNPSKRG